MLLLTEGQMNDHMGARLLVPMLPKSRELLADRGYGLDVPTNQTSRVTRARPSWSPTLPAPDCCAPQPVAALTSIGRSGRSPSPTTTT